MAKAKKSRAVAATNNIYLLCDFLDDLRDVRKLKTPRRYCFILGSGASLPSGIMSGRELTTNWIKELFLRCHPVIKSIDATEDKVSSWATANRLGIKGFTYANRAAFYGEVFAKRFHSDPKLGQEYLRHIITGKTPSFGYSVLARILASTDHSIVITTNFDHLTEDALQRYAGIEPLVIGDEEIAKYFAEDHRRPAIAKIHGDIFRKTYNAIEDIENLRGQWENPIRAILKNHIPIFIGYGGNDPGFMQFLINEKSDDWLPNGLIWAYRPKSGIPANPLIQKLIAKYNGRYLPIPGFDEFMLLLGDVFEIGKLDKEMEAENAKRLEEYRKSFNSVVSVLRDDKEFTDVEHYPELVRTVITRLAGEKAARGWWDWEIESQKETEPEKRRQVYEEAQKFLPESPQLLSAYTWFLSTNFPLYPEAESLGRRAVELAEKSLGAEHPDTVSSRINLASLYRNKGDYNKAQLLLEQTLEIGERVLGPEHPGTLTSRNNLAMLYEDKGEYDKALPLFEQTLAIRERIEGAENPSTLTSRNNLAMLYQDKGEYNKALPLLEQTLAIRERMLGAEHRDTLNSRNNLAFLYRVKGDYDKAQLLLEQTLPICERVLGAENPVALISRNNLAMLYQEKGEYDKALPLVEQTLAIAERVLGAEHPDTLTSRSNLAVLYQSKGDNDKALHLHEQILAIRKRVLGLEHPDTLTSQNNLASLYQAKGDYNKAQLLFEQTLDIRQRVLGSEHPGTLNSRNNLASLYQDKGEYDKALPLLEQTLAIRERILGAENPSTLNSRNNLATLYCSKSDYSKALPLLEQTLKECEKILGQDHPHSNTVRDNLNTCREKLKNNGNE